MVQFTEVGVEEMDLAAKAHLKKVTAIGKEVGGQVKKWAVWAIQKADVDQLRLTLPVKAPFRAPV